MGAGVRHCRVPGCGEPGVRINGTTRCQAHATEGVRVKASGRTGAPISKQVRFEVFKRDEFTCRYCGRSTPDVTLHVDHVVAVANGGTDEMDNLVTSCFECNLGKSDTPLSHVRGRNDGRFSARDRIFYIRGIIRNRFPDCDQDKVLYLLRQAWAIGMDLEKLETLSITAPTLPTIYGRIYGAFQLHEEGLRR